MTCADFKLKMIASHWELNNFHLENEEEKTISRKLIAEQRNNNSCHLERWHCNYFQFHSQVTIQFFYSPKHMCNLCLFNGLPMYNLITLRVNYFWHLKVSMECSLNDDRMTSETFFHNNGNEDLNLNELTFGYHK